MNKNILIAIAVAVPFMGYILFSESFNETLGLMTKTSRKLKQPLNSLTLTNNFH